MQKKVLIGLSGEAGSGKDFGAALMAEMLGGEVISFAKPVYELSSIMFGTTVAELARRSTKESYSWFSITQRSLIEAADYLAELVHQLGIDCDHIYAIQDFIFTELEPFEEPISHFVEDTIAVYRISPRKILELIGTELGRKRVTTGIWSDLVKNKFTSSEHSIIITDVRFPNEHELVKSSGGYRFEIVAPSNPNAIKSTHESANHKLPSDLVIINTYDGGFKLNIEKALEETH